MTDLEVIITLLLITVLALWFCYLVKLSKTVENLKCDIDDLECQLNAVNRNIKHLGLESYETKQELKTYDRNIDRLIRINRKAYKKLVKTEEKKYKKALKNLDKFKNEYE